MLRIQHVAEFLQAAVLRAATGGVPQVVHDVRHVHFTCNAAGTEGLNLLNLEHVEQL